MPFYVVMRKTSGDYLSMQGNSWVIDIRDAAVYTARSAATSAIRRTWRETCTVQRITRLPDRIPRGGRRRVQTTSPSRS
jgi:hypothetical protein